MFGQLDFIYLKTELCSPYVILFEEERAGIWDSFILFSFVEC